MKWKMNDRGQAVTVRITVTYSTIKGKNVSNQHFYRLKKDMDRDE